MKMLKKIGLLTLFLMMGTVVGARAEDAAAPEAKPAAAAVEVVPQVETVVPAPPASAVLAAEIPAAAVATDNLEFISGEISSLDEAAKSVSVRLYGETEGATDEKTLTVNLDENTDITDGEQDRDLKSLTVGTEVDVEYDPATNKATYIFVY